MAVRAIAIAALALLLAGLVVRQAFVDAYGERNPRLAAAIWPGHPSVVLASGLAEVGAVAASGKPVPPTTIRQMLLAGGKSPLAPEPFLVRGVEGQLAGDQSLTLRAFQEARSRDPRSVAARYFLADHFLRTNQTQAGLSEISALTKLVPQSRLQIGPYLAAFARAPGGAANVRALLRDQPDLEPLLLQQLAANPDDAALALSLWSGRHPEQDRAWQVQLMESLVKAGRFQEARSAWTRFDPGARRDGELVDPNFEGRSLPPFGWALVSGPAGVAEPAPGGRLHVIYYGRDDLVLADQLLMLKPGRYRLSMRVSNASPMPRSLTWLVRCLPPVREPAAIGFGSVKGGMLAGDFAVPAQGCEAQRLELAGKAPDVPEQADVTLSELRLERSGQ